MIPFFLKPESSRQPSTATGQSTRNLTPGIRIRLSVSVAIGLLTLLIACAPGSAQVYNNPNAGGQSPARAEQMYQRAKQAFAAGDYMAAVELLKAAKNFNASDKNIIHLLALAYAEAGDNYNAMMWFRSALSLDYNFLECRNNYGLFLWKTGKTKIAMKEFRKCISINPNYPDPHYNLGVILREQGDLNTAIEEFRTAIRLRPNYFNAQRELGIAIYEKYEQGGLKDISDSIQHLQQAARLIPKNPMVHFYLARVWNAQGNLDEGEKELRLALRNDSQLAAGHYELAKLRYFRGDPDRCLYELNQAFKVNPRYTESKKYPGINSRKMRELSAKSNELKGMMIDRCLMLAADDWKRVAQQSRDTRPYEKKIKNLVRESKRRRKGKRRKKGAPVFDASEVQALIKRGISETDEGDFRGAMRTFNRVIELNPNAFEGHQQIGSLYEVQGDYNRAMTAYNRAISIVPDYDGLYYNKAYLLEKMRLPVEAGRMYKKFHTMAGKYPYDPKHVIQLQLEDIRQQRRNAEFQRHGF